MTNCKNCKKFISYIGTLTEGAVLFCSETCVSEYAEQYAQDNWKDIAYMMGARIVE